jgi:hypothetical protein
VRRGGHFRMTKRIKKCRKAVGPRRRCRRTAVAEVRAKGRWNPICWKHALEFRSLFGEQPEFLRRL